jgi:GT2 family glycosyltransferase
MSIRRQREWDPATAQVVIAVLTYRRPHDLAELLPMLTDQADRHPGAVDILVVDNDPDAGAKDAVGAAAAAWQGRLRYAHEPRPGIAAARNRALEDSAGYGTLIFIDDDERPVESWLDDLLATYTRFPGPGVVGPVVSRFDVPLSDYVRAGAFFDRRRMPTGSTVTVAATNNLLLDLALVRSTGIAFDEAFGLSGGSDTLFTRRLVAAGGPLIWCDEAIVTDVVPAARSGRDWVLRRQLRSGNSWSRTELALATTRRARARTRLMLTVIGGVRVAGGAARLLLGTVTRSLRHRARGAKTLARGSGIVLGAYGYTYVEYRR